ncbi:N-alpha-acetyltransferase 60-like isoform X2 [Varroa jacobsoni]|uniref:N-alpha-acetyltransferase 60 n=1 Tax=Varroa destructor TaxID=109461 RepID=A0A7M7MJ80_VARDE|nr:N-alpha-acetyltransferase 60-like isoform X2 [Varroa destructor]XP_022706730.1 N-alpha-acetyltransferase 60-like isoform X2 [Varroa jacobsoni]
MLEESSNSEDSTSPKSFEKATVRISYRRLRPSDVEATFVLANSVLPLFYPRFFLKKVIDSTTGTAIGAFNEDEKLVGFILGDFDLVFVPRALTQVEQKKGFCIMLVGVDKSFQSLGIGTRLVKLVIDPESSPTIANADFVYLHVMTEHLRAIRVYESVGFKRMVVWPKYYALNPARDAFVMFKLVSPKFKGQFL